MSDKTKVSMHSTSFNIRMCKKGLRKSTARKLSMAHSVIEVQILGVTLKMLRKEEKKEIK